MDSADRITPSLSKSWAGSRLLTFNTRILIPWVTVRSFHQIKQTSPGGFERLKVRMMENFIQLNGYQTIDLGDSGIDHRDCISAESNGALKYLPDERSYQLLAAPGRFRILSAPPS